jgi:hypothetical protein
MTENPYKAIMPSAKRTPTLPGQDNPVADKTGEINASSKKDLVNQISSILQASSSEEGMQTSTSPEVLKERRTALAEAMEDPGAFQLLGAAIASDIQDTTSREGICRRYLQYSELGQGESNMVRLREHNVTAYMATSTTEVTPVYVRNKTQYPQEFNNTAMILIDLKELAQSTGDLLEEKYEEGLEAIMVQEDRLWKTAADAAASVRNTLQVFTSFTPQIMSRVKSQVGRWGLPITSCLIAYDIWDDIIGTADFGAFFDPVTKYELVRDGILGSMLGVSIQTDSHRQKNFRILNDGEVYMVAAPINHGVIKIRGSMVMEPINKFDNNLAQKGWFMHELVTLMVGNSLSVAKGQRI